MGRVVVTGGGGFIGSHLVDALIENGLEVTIIDTLGVNRERYVHPRAYLAKMSVTSSDIRDYCLGAEYIFHCAALPRIQPSIRNPELFHDVNVNGTLNVLMAAKEAGVKRVIYSASSSVYGDQKTLPLREDMTPHPKNPYALQKLIGEMYCRFFWELYGLETVSLRYFNVYGPRQADVGAYATVIGIFLKQWREGVPLTIVPDGTQTRDFTHVSDVVRANLSAMTSPTVGQGEVINIGTGEAHSIFDVAKFFGGQWQFCEPRIGEARHTRADIRKARELLHWQPSVSLEEGIEELKKTA